MGKRSQKWLDAFRKPGHAFLETEVCFPALHDSLVVFTENIACFSVDYSKVVHDEFCPLPLIIQKGKAFIECVFALARPIQGIR